MFHIRFTTPRDGRSFRAGLLAQLDESRRRREEAWQRLLQQAASSEPAIAGGITRETLRDSFCIMRDWPR